MPGTPLFVRSAEHDDVEALSAIGTDSFLAAYGETADPEAIDQHVEALFGASRIRAEMEEASCHYMIAMLGDSPTGLLKLRSGTPPDVLAGRNVLEVQQLYVHSDYQGYGVGRALIDAAVSHAREMRFEAIWLQAWSRADWALAFYRRNLFRRIGELPYHLGGQTFEDWLLLREL